MLQKQEEQPENVNAQPADVPGELIITMVTRAVSAIVQRLNSLANFEGTDSKVRPNTFINNFKIKYV